MATYSETEFLIARPCPRCYSDVPPSGICGFCGWSDRPKAKPEESPVLVSADARYVIGLDLGQVSDPSALCLLEQRERQDGAKRVNDFVCPYLRRWPLGTPYPQVVRDVVSFAATLPLPALVLDGTGVGRAIADEFRRARPAVSALVIASITGGTQTVRHPNGEYTVAKRELAGSLRSVLEGRRIKIARRLKEGVNLMRELQTFSVKISATAHESYEALRSSDHDDLAVAVALALWWAERGIKAQIVIL
jgi:hypothetical protein